MIRPAIIAGLTMVLFAGRAVGAELEYGVSAGIGTSDNIARVPVNEESEDILTAGLELRLVRQSARLDADLNIDLDYFDYQDDTYDSEVTGRASADVMFRFVPERFEWILQDSFGQLEQDPFSASTPATRENVNFLTTGPDFTVRLGSVGNLTVSGRYSATQYEESPFDDERLLGGLSLEREFSERSRLSLNATSERVEFDDATTGSDYDRQSAFLRYDVDGARTRIGIEAGYTEIHDLGDTSSSPLVELDIERDISPRSTVTLLAGIRSSDAATSLRTGLGSGAPVGAADPVSTTDPFETRHATLGWNFTTPRTTLRVAVGGEEDEYETQSLLDRERRHASLYAQRRISPRIELSALAALYETDFNATSQEDDETHFGIYLSWNVSGRLFIDLEAEKFDRESSNPLTEFDETRAFLRFTWRNRGGGAGAG